MVRQGDSPNAQVTLITFPEDSAARSLDYLSDATHGREGRHVGR